MCGRFACSEIPKPLAEAFGLTAPDDLPARLNIAPSMPVAALIRDEESGAPAFGWLQWGLVPFWARERSIGNRMFNARAETVHEKPSFRAAFRHRRCLIPADGFYEWGSPHRQKRCREEEAPGQAALPLVADEPAHKHRNAKTTAGKKVPHFITLTDAPMVFAGLWETWTGPGEEILLSCTILTTDANERVRPIHDRMPVILRPEDWKLWMDRGVQNRRDLEPLLAPSESERLHIEETEL